jgi:hypothetical protein
MVDVGVPSGKAAMFRAMRTVPSMVQMSLHALSGAVVQKSQGSSTNGEK